MKMLLIITLSLLCSCNRLNNNSGVRFDSQGELCIQDEVLCYIFDLRIQHPNIVYAQACLESGNFTSAIWIENNNCMGMRLAYQRATTAIGASRGHAKYNTWKDCILDYAIWQSIYARNLTKDEYYSKLQRIYAEDANYISRLKRLNRDAWEK